MANFRSLGDLNREDSDDDRDDTNDYYAGGEKRCARAPDKTTVLFLCEILTPPPPLSLSRSFVFFLVLNAVAWSSRAERREGTPATGRWWTTSSSPRGG